MVDGGTGESFDLGAVSDEEARRWQDYAERWGTDQCDEGSWMWTVVDYVVLAYVVVAGLVSTGARVWLVLVDLGLVD